MGIFPSLLERGGVGTSFAPAGAAVACAKFIGQREFLIALTICHSIMVSYLTAAANRDKHLPQRVAQTSNRRQQAVRIKICVAYPSKISKLLTMLASHDIHRQREQERGYTVA